MKAIYCSKIGLLYFLSINIRGLRITRLKKGTFKPTAPTARPAGPIRLLTYLTQGQTQYQEIVRLQPADAGH